LEKAVLIEMCPASVKMTTISLIGGAYFKKSNKISETIRFDEDIYENQSISIAKLNECIKHLNMFKELCEFNTIIRIYCVASPIFLNVKNARGLFEEISNSTGFNFNILNDEDEVKYVYNAILNSVEPNKAVILYINPNNTLIVNFAKRNILSTHILDFGANSLAFKFKDRTDTENIIKEMKQEVKEKLKQINLEINLEEIGFIGAGQYFLALSRLVRKITRYPLDQDNNFCVTKQNFDKAFNILKENGFDRTKRLATNISNERLDNIMSGFIIMEAFFETYSNENFYITTKKISDAIIASKILKETTVESNTADVLETSLENIRYYYNIEDSNSEWVYNFTKNLFKQTGIIHKLTRKHFKALRIAAAMYDCGKRVDFENHSKYSKDIILNSKIYGASHKDIVTAAFACQFQNLENFQLAEWIKFKNIIDEDDLTAARKIGVLIKLSESLDCNKQQKISDVNCDILGEIVIIKVKTNADASYEMIEAEKVSPAFKKVFNKDFQII
jgi:exopolyphosphatase/guanosine-5'-triphosphate,3'-diphosphate pyrophosphatase